MKKILYIWFDDANFTEQPVRLGVLHAEPIRGKEVFSFEFDNDWLKSPLCRLIDPDLQLYRGHQYLDEQKSNFGVFMDSAPDRWGRVLLDRRETITAQEENRPPCLLMESDYLAGVFDESRMGALRIQTMEKGPYVDYDPELAAPPFSQIRDLEYASLQLEKDDHTQSSRWLKMLLAPGSSLGGARPKANVRDNHGALWIAKFPSRNDRCDVGAWEAVCMTLAKQCGIRVPDFEVRQFNSHYHTFLSRRFDRKDATHRIHFSSAMTMLGYSDGAEHVSYLELADWITRNCCHVEENLHELFRRMVFNIIVSNTDDHLRNHGFLLTKEGWQLSPAYDINPDEYGDSLSLNITETDNRLNIDLAREVAPYFSLTIAQADEIILHTRTICAHFREIASRYHISREEQERKAHAFFLV